MIIKNFDFRIFGTTQKILIVNPIRIDKEIEKKQSLDHDVNSVKKSEELVKHIKI